jgi:hypothetical protein
MRFGMSCLEEALGAIAAQRNFALPTFAVQFAKFAVSRIVPNIDHRTVVDIP